MDKALIENWNDTVQPRDEVFHLGDFAFRNHLDYKTKLHGKIHWVLGNHDKCSEAVKSQFSSVSQMLNRKVETTPFFMFHYPCVTWWGKGHGTIHLYGHTHGRYNKPGQASLDVGVDSHNFRPLSLEAVLALAEQNQNASVQQP